MSTASDFIDYVPKDPELDKREWKRSEIPTASGIYAIVNLVNGKRYVGSSANLRKRWWQHRARLRVGNHHSCHLQRSWDKHGEASFAFKVIEFVPVDFLLDIEQKYLDENNGGYNISKCSDAPQKGRKISEEQRKKLSIALKGRKKSPETRARMSAASKGKKKTHPPYVRTPEQRAHMSAKMKGRIITTAARAKISAKSSGNKYCVGRVLSKETREKISTSLKKRHHQ